MIVWKKNSLLTKNVFDKKINNFQEYSWILECDHPDNLATLLIRALFDRPILVLVKDRQVVVSKPSTIY